MDTHFIIRRFIQDFSVWEKEYVGKSISSRTSTNDFVTYLVAEGLTADMDAKTLADEMAYWMDITMEDMVFTFRKLHINVKHVLLFIKENQNRYFERSHLAKCPQKHVLGIFPTNDGMDGGKGYCPYCEKEIEFPSKMNQQVVYNWKTS